MSKLSFWAQALDNSSPSTLIEAGKKIAHQDGVRRREFVNKLSEITEQPIFYSQAGATLRIVENRFTMRLLCKELDQAGRQATVVCFGEIGENEAWVTETTDELKKFASSLGRTIEETTIEACGNGLKILVEQQKKNLRWKSTLLPLLWMLALLAGVIAGRLVVRY